MRTISVNVQPDYLLRLTRVKKPVIALAELIWNGLDADATHVGVEFETNLLGAITAIRVRDNGVGIVPELAVASFENLGGSWKQRVSKSPTGRLLHGRAGKGRFRAFSLGTDVRWNTVALVGKTLREYSVSGSAEQLKVFQVSDPVESAQKYTGTEVVISNITKGFKSLRGPDAAQAIAEEFAIYLREYADIEVVYDGSRIDPAAVERARFTYELGPIELDDGRTLVPSLLVIEWKVETERGLFLCDADGFALERATVGIQAPGFHFTAYLRDDYLRELHKQGRLVLEDMDAGLTPVLDAARDKLRDHFRGRAALVAAELVSEWKQQAVYPFSGEAKDSVETAKRQVFDVVALSVHNFLPEFRQADAKSKRLQLRLLKQAIEDSPAAVQRILQDVLDLPPEKQQELADLLEKTNLSAIIAASKLVTDRLDFLRGLECLVFQPELKNVLLERRQLHRIVENHTWIFGEEFNLTVSDQSLTDVLRKHQSRLGRELDDAPPVLREDGSIGIVDLMLSRRVPQPRADQHEHLIVELKRPTKRIDLDVISQLESYAFAVARDERFRDTNTRWIFWAVSNDLNDDARRKARQKDRPEGLVHDDEELRVQIWVKSWAQIIDAAKARLGFFQEGLEYEASDEHAVAYLKRVHDGQLPSEIAQYPAARHKVKAVG